MRAFRADPHLLQRQADFTADVFAAVVGGEVHIAGFVVRLFGGPAVFVEAEKIKFLLRAEGKAIADFRRVRNGPLEQRAGVALEGTAVRVGDGREHAHDLAMLGTPRQQRKRLRLRVQQQVGVRFVPEAGDGGAVERNAVGKGAGQLIRHNGNVLLPAENVAEGQADELHVLLLHILHNLLLGISHIRPRFLSVCNVHLLIRIFAVGRDDGKGRVEYA